MSKDTFMNPDYKPDKNTRQEIEKLHDEGVSLSGIYLKYADMKNTKLINVDLSGSDLTRADFSGASMYGANLEGANLFKANFEGANLKSANLKKCDLLGTDFSNTKLNNVDWGEGHKILNEQQAEAAIQGGNAEKAKEKYRESEDIYRALKISLKTQTLGDDVGKFFEREMIARRKQMSKYSPLRIISKLAHLTIGYGEKIGNIIYTVFGIITVCTFLYGIEGVRYGTKIIGFGAEHLQDGISATIGNLFYFSVVVFTTVGFGDIAPIGPLGKIIVIIEGIIGGVIMAILIIALYKRLMDR